MKIKNPEFLWNHQVQADEELYLNKGVLKTRTKKNPKRFSLLERLRLNKICKQVDKLARNTPESCKRDSGALARFQGNCRTLMSRAEICNENFFQRHFFPCTLLHTATSISKHLSNNLPPGTLEILSSEEGRSATLTTDPLGDIHLLFEEDDNPPAIETTTEVKDLKQPRTWTLALAKELVDALTERVTKQSRAEEEIDQKVFRGCGDKTIVQELKKRLLNKEGSINAIIAEYETELKYKIGANELSSLLKDLIANNPSIFTGCKDNADFSQSWKALIEKAWKEQWNNTEGRLTTGNIYSRLDAMKTAFQMANDVISIDDIIKL